jgi:hypothetical protein
VSTVLNLNLRKRQPKGWHRNPCAVHKCRKAGGGRRLCDEHHGVMLSTTAARLGTTPTWVAVNSAGYVTVGGLKPYGRTVTEHKLVMERALGRELVAGENVHHKNRPENLELWVSFQPSGQRPQDLVIYARELLARYAARDCETNQLPLPTQTSRDTTHLRQMPHLPPDHGGQGVRVDLDEIDTAMVPYGGAV